MALDLNAIKIVRKGIVDNYISFFLDSQNMFSSPNDVFENVELGQFVFSEIGNFYYNLYKNMFGFDKWDEWHPFLLRRHLMLCRDPRTNLLSTLCYEHTLEKREYEKT